MRKTPSPKTPAASPAPSAAPVLTLFDAPPAPKTKIVTKTKAVSKPKVAPKTIAASKIPVKAAVSKPTPVRVVAETPSTYFTGDGGRAWRMSGKHAVAYVKNAALAGELLDTEPRHLAKTAMAVYYDRKGKPFAWQVRFDTNRWEEVTGRLS